jgi:hypothetical protein
MQLKLEHSRPKSPVHIIWGGLAILLMAAGGLARNHLQGLPECVFKDITGIPCLTCGGTRSIAALSRFDFVGSFVFNPLAMVSALTAILFSLLILLGMIFKRAFNLSLTAAEARVLRYSAGATIVANWLYLIVSMT